ncbi:serine/threonine-protein kinase [Massilia jejuensis]|uniref:Serine/threonine-protein kinase n=1 Tax=Massilia jejuensis TaxID=648894 RepID=A0ABW0PCG0_9BURK
MAAQNNAPLPEGLEIAGYRIVKKIASGGFSIVYLAYDAEGSAVAIKEYLPSALALRQPGELAPSIARPNQPLFRIGLKCFFEEGRALARINHPNVVRIVNFFRAHDTVYMVMAYESGQSLQEHIARSNGRNTGKGGPRGGGLGEGFIRKTFDGICRGLRETHANKLLHLDLKPANIYLRSDGSPILLDFGAARQAVGLDAPLLAPMYTPGFAPPDLYAKGAPLGPWSDIYGLGAAMFACMTGAPPQAADARKLDDRLGAQFDALAGHYSPELLDMVRACLALDPMARPQSVFAVHKVLQAAPARPLAAEPVAASAPPAGALRALLGRIGLVKRTRRGGQ